jgi:hypothetical protein
MPDAQRKQVSEAPLEARRPTPRGRHALGVLVLLCVAGMTAAVVWLVILPHQGQRPRQIENHPPLDRYGNPRVDHDGALERMHKVAAALESYRYTMGGGVRWPGTLDELKYAGLIDADFDLTGLLSGELLVYQPQMPFGHDPERWVMVHDIEYGRVRSRGYGARHGIVSAVVILGDGTVCMLDGKDEEMYGGLTRRQEAAR